MNDLVFVLCMKSAFLGEEKFWIVTFVGLSGTYATGRIRQRTTNPYGGDGHGRMQLHAKRIEKQQLEVENAPQQDAHPELAVLQGRNYHRDRGEAECSHVWTIGGSGPLRRENRDVPSWL